MPPIAFSQSATVSNRFSLANDFGRLAELVRGSRPETVVLVARKMPRLCSALSLHFGTARVISDMAIPLSEPILRGCRVAIVDDFINAGTTIDRVERLVRQLAPNTVDKFAIASRRTFDSEERSHFVRTDLLDQDEYRRIVSSLPRLFDAAAEAYDLEFPHIPCKYSVEIPDTDSLIASLRASFGSEAVNRVPSASRSTTKITLTLPFSSDGTLRKIRFYDEPDGHGFILVPISVPQQFGHASAGHLVEDTCRHLRSVDQLPSAVEQVVRTDVFSRLELFLRSLGLYLDLITQYEVFNLARTDTVFDVNRATLAFGPKIMLRSVIDYIVKASCEINRLTATASITASTSSPFSSSHIFNRLLESAAHNSTRDPKRILYSVFDALSELVCSEDPQCYTLKWPYTPTQVSDDPYLRLRIGPTFADLVDLLTRLVPSFSHSVAQIHVSHFLDAAIDSGTVVPTIGYMNGVCYRIYRKGEAGAEDRALDVLDIAVEDCKQTRSKPEIPYTDTHISKVVAALTFSGAVPSYFGVKTADRGTVACTKSSVLSDGGVEVGKLLKAKHPDVAIRKPN